MNQKTFLVTGVAGLLGSRFANYLIDNGHKVIGIDDLSGGFEENINPKTKFYKQDLTKDISNVFKENKIDIIYHFAAYAAEGLSPFIRTYNYDNNLKATANLINHAITNNIERFVFTSSLAVYGYGEGGIFNENQIPRPIDPYGVAKYACEMDLRIAGEQHNLDWCIIRPHNVYGLGQNIWDKYRNVLGIWMYQTLNDEPMTIFGEGDQSRAFSCIDDILKPLFLSGISPKASKEIINLGGVEEWTILDANKLLKKIMGQGETIFLEPRHEVKAAIPTFKKSKDLLEFEHLTTLESGLTKMWEWAKIQPNRKRFKWDQYEIEKGLYTFWK